jgi:hypothetical protein
MMERPGERPWEAWLALGPPASIGLEMTQINYFASL